MPLAQGFLELVEQGVIGGVKIELTQDAGLLLLGVGLSRHGLSLMHESGAQLEVGRAAPTNLAE
ncbi:hypothetical protein GCM10025883_45290 [Mobilicoccus caccae]|uniref:Uncharacterized protein n=1 Tax=Mobilicoccus caccae TaxID=1859295 RepID=A0ABQ6IY78_9MICO|nr:hypothetical protein GCM10025883_44540 [Mobilicoccus caccae]GMA42484.1 hypothetical protein GCM10025883_45290 [Mobilicoccus caccae]